MKMWENDCGERFETEEDARESVYEDMTIDDYFTYLEDNCSIRKLLSWAWKQSTFFDDFYDEIKAAEEEYFLTYYHEIEEDEEEEE